MAVETRNRLLDQIDRLFHRGVLGASTDQQLLQRFLADRDEEAFEAIVIRHGPMVLGLCRRYLRDPRDIEDAFQATFLILVRKARSLRDHQLLANWLYGVAYRVAVRARKVAMRTRTFETSVANMESPAPEEAVVDEIGPELDQELNRLPARYRSALVLCYLQGMTQEKAAEELRCPLGTLRSRLARGRDLLKRRLIARGYTASASLIAATLRAPMPTIPIIRAVVASAVQALSSSRIATLTGVSVAETLAEGVLSSMAATSLKRIALTATAIALTTGGITAYAYWPTQNIEGKQNKPAAEPVRKPDDEVVLQPAHKVKPGDFVRIEVHEALPGRPISGIRLVRPDGTISLGYYGDLQVAGLDRYEIKVKVIKHLRKYLTDYALGLIETDGETGGPVFKTNQNGKKIVSRIQPIDSDRVFVDESVIMGTPEESLGEIREEMKHLREKLDQLSALVSKEDLNQESGGKSEAELLETTGNQLDSEGARNEAAKLIHLREDLEKSTDSKRPRDPYDVRDRDTPKPFYILNDEIKGLFNLKEMEITVSEIRLEKKEISQDDLLQVKNSLKPLLPLIPPLIHRAQEELEEAEARLRDGENKDQELSEMSSELLRRLEEKKRLAKEGKATEEEVLDAEGDLNSFMNTYGWQSEYDQSSRKFEVEIARYILKEAEQLKAKYLDDPKKN